MTSFTNANNSAKGSDKVLYTYDKAGNLATVTKQNGTIDAGTITYTYDGNNNLVSLRMKEDMRKNMSMMSKADW